jgi:hypothetical protein
VAAAALAVVDLVWSSTFAALRIIETVPAWLGGGARFVLAEP